MPGITFRLAAILRNDHNKIYLGGLYPIPHGKLKLLIIKIGLSFMPLPDRNLVLIREQKLFKGYGCIANNTFHCAFIMKDREYRLRRSKNHLLYRPSDNILIGSKYMKFLLDLPIVNNDLMWMLASYNAGPGNFKKWTKIKNIKIVTVC